jgi:epoxyqueuosine reductase
MDYLKRHLNLKRDPKTILSEAKSVICVGMNYYTIEPDPARKVDPLRGQISRYAWGDDYHDIIRAKLKKLVKIIEKIARKETRNRVFVDSGPILEREYAQNAGLGWLAKNTNLINWEKGSWYFLAEILIDIPLQPDQIEPRGSCGTCTLCIEACPTDAIIEPNILDSRLCISYLTIELKESIPREIRSKTGNLIFGCDICQEVCPWNNKATSSLEKGFQPRKGNLLPKLTSLMNMTQEEFNQRFKGSPVKRSKRRGFLRNVAVALGNSKDKSAVIVLGKALNDSEPLVRGHAAWGLGQIGGNDAVQALKERLEVEENPEIINELKFAIDSI